MPLHKTIEADIRVVGHFAQFYCSLSSDMASTRFSWNIDDNNEACCIRFCIAQL